MHLVHGDSRDDVFWLHSHGLHEIGFCDFDLLEPHPSSHEAGYEALRALAFAIVEGGAAADGSPLALVQPGTPIQLVSSRRFLAQAGAGRWTRWRESVDDEHLDGHAVVCDPPSRSWFGLGGKTLRPASLFSSEFPETGLIHFSNDATALMGERARNTYEVFRALRDELADLELPALVKVGYPVDGGGEDDREHLWFEVHACRDRELEGTLLNQPFNIARMRQGDRGAHAVDQISDWMIVSPFGRITPAFGMALREMRSRGDEVRKALAAARASPQ